MKMFDGGYDLPKPKRVEERTKPPRPGFWRRAASVLSVVVGLLWLGCLTVLLLLATVWALEYFLDQ